MAGKKVNNRFKLFTNKTSLAKKNSRLLTGGVTEEKGNKLGWWERAIIEKDIFTDFQYKLGPQHEGRPDLVSTEVYRTSTLAWLVLQYNSIVDLEEEFVAGTIITLPSNSRVFSEISTQNPQNEPFTNE